MLENDAFGDRHPLTSLTPPQLPHLRPYHYAISTTLSNPTPLHSTPPYPAHPGRWSQFTFLLLLSDGYQGGETIFYPPELPPAAVRTPKGAALCFPHGGHPLHSRHAGGLVESGLKYMIRTGTDH